MKKSYKGFGLWVVALIVGYIPLTYLISNTVLSTRLSLIYCAGMIAFLTHIIYKNDRIYWYTGVLFEDAEKAAPEQRANFAYAHFKIFIKFACIQLIFTATAALFDIAIWFDILFFSVGLIVAALSTIKIKL